MTIKKALQKILKGILHKERNPHMIMQETMHSLEATNEQRRPRKESVILNTTSQQTPNTLSKRRRKELLK